MSIDLTALLGFRQAQIMRHLWAHGPATVRELHTEIAAVPYLVHCGLAPVVGEGATAKPPIYSDRGLLTLKF